MFINLKRNWHVLDGSSPGGKGLMLAGTHEVERIRHPFGQDGFWIVLKGTLIGAAEAYWLSQKDATITDGPPNQTTTDTKVGTAAKV